MSAEGHFPAAATADRPAAQHLAYRPEVDGLRAIAVMSVVLFHAKIQGFSGGYIGVDIFFVISGYLITSILAAEHQQGRYSLLAFYERRARRILPALFFVLAVCAPLAWVLLVPSQMKEFSQSFVATSLFASNFFFWRKSGYFDTVADEKPLLHTWSLGVEEQFYLLFPLFVALLWRYGRGRLIFAITVVAVASFVLGVLGLRQDPTAVFYFAPTRAWQLLAGAAIALGGADLSRRWSPRPVVGSVLSTIGLVMVLVPVFAFDEHTPFPSLYSLIPIIGTCLILQYAQGGALAERLLSLRGMVGIGLISYSAYLWHQPVFAFFRVLAPGKSAPWLSLTLVGLSLLLAYISWRFVEQPFRDRKRIGRQSIFVISAAGTVAMIAFGLAGHLSGGFKGRLDPYSASVLATAAPSPKREACHPKGAGALDLGRACTYFEGDVTWAAFGNSHVVELAYALAERLKPRGQGLLHLSISGCPPALDYDWAAPECRPWINQALQRIERDGGIRNVLVAFRHTSVLMGNQLESYPQVSAGPVLRLGDRSPAESAELYWKSFSEIVRRLQVAGKRVFVVLPIPELGQSVERNVWQAHGGDPGFRRGTSYSYYQQRNSYVLGRLRALKESGDVVLVDPASLLCEGADCYAVKGDVAMYYDDNHLSVRGAEAVVGLLAPYIEQDAR